MNKEISALIETLHGTEQRLEELTAGEVDTVADRDGRTLLLRRAQDHLRHHEAAKQAAILNALPVHIALLDIQGFIISVNEAWRRFGRASAPQGPGYEVGVNYLGVCDSAHGDDAAGAQQAAKGIRSVLEGAEESFSLEYSCQSGTEHRWFLMTVTPLGEDHPSGAVVMHMNITKRKQAEKALQESKNLLQLVVENVPSRIFWKDRNLQYLGCNSRFAQDAGHSRPDELTGKTDFEMGWKDQAELYRADDRAVLESGDPKLNIEEPQTAPNGNTIWLRTSKVPLRDKDNQIIGVLGLYQDITHHKHAQDEIKRLSRFPEENPNPVLRIGRDGAILYANQASTPIVTTWGRVVGQNLSDDWRQLIAGTFESGLTKEVNIACDGRIFSCNLAPILAEDYVNVYGRDITEQQHAVEALRTSEAEFRTLAESMPQIVWITRPDGWNIYLNHQWMDYTGLTFEDSLGHGWNKTFHPDDQQPAWEAWRRATLENGTYSIEARLRRADGVYRWWLVRGVPLQEATGNILKWFGTCTDIHDLKIAELAISRANEELRESERRFNDLLQHVELVAVMLDHEGHITYCNDYLLRLAGWRQEEVIGKNWFELFLPPEISDSKDAYYASLLSNPQEERHHENEILTRSGQRRLIHWNNSVLRSGAGEVIGTASIGEDITERKKAEEVVRQRAAELERFHRLSVGRELQMIELKKQINDLAKQAGQEPPYELAFLALEPVRTKPDHR
ncbi:MAG: PAS domain S-box protein [Thiobacillaceae bacterium]